MSTPPPSSGSSCSTAPARSARCPLTAGKPYLRRDPRNAAILAETTRFGSFLSDLAGFDAEFFGVSPREAELMDPQQRLALEVSWEALEHAGVPPRALAGSDTAVLMGVNSDDYGKLVMEDLPGIEAWTGIGTSLCGIANRVSHLLDLRGPSVALDAACAASLVAVHQACQLLRAGETSLALAGGVSALIGPGLTRVLDVAGATAPDGRCKSFDESADGYGRGEGAAVVVLKRLADAGATTTGCWPWSVAARWPRTAAPSASCPRTGRRRRTCSAAPAAPPASTRRPSTSWRRTAPAPRPVIRSN
jgi:6-methylsalicylic acid synthase